MVAGERNTQKLLDSSVKQDKLVAGKRKTSNLSSKNDGKKECKVSMVAGDCNQTDLLGQGEEKTQRKQHPRDVFNNLFHSNNMEIITEHPTYKFEK